MQIVFGACLFVIAVILLAYVPGKLLLMALKRALTPLEDVTLACVLGLVVSGVVYWLMTFAQQGRFYLVWPLTAAGVYVWLHSSKRKSLLRNSASLEPPSQGKREAVVRQVSTCLGRSSGAWNYRVGISAPLLHEFHVAGGWHDARLSSARCPFSHRDR